MRTPFNDIFKTDIPSSRQEWALMTRPDSLQQLPRQGSRADFHSRHGIVHAPRYREYKYSAIFGRVAGAVDREIHESRVGGPP